MPKATSSAELHTRAVRDWTCAVLAFLMLVLVVALSWSDGRILPSFLTAAPTPPPTTEPQPRPLARGSIYVPSADSRLCEVRQIDNTTGRISRAGTVLCDQTGSLPQQDKQPPRIEAIRDSFFPRK